MSRSGAAYLLPGQALDVPGLVSGDYYIGQQLVSATTLANPGNGIGFYQPLWVSNAGGVIIATIGVETTVVSAAGGVCRLGIYNANANRLAGSLVLDAGTVDTTTGPGGLEITVNQALPPGLYWKIAVPQGAPATHATYRATSTGPALVPNGSLAATFRTAFTTGGSVNGALPATATGGTNVATTGIATYVKAA